MSEIYKIKFEKTFGLWISTVLFAPSATYALIVGILTNRIQLPSLKSREEQIVVAIITLIFMAGFGFYAWFVRVKYKEYEVSYRKSIHTSTLGSR